MRIKGVSLHKAHRTEMGPAGAAVIREDALGMTMAMTGHFHMRRNTTEANTGK